MLEWAFSGVDFTLYGNGGPECVNYLPRSVLVFETFIIVAYALMFELYYPWKRSVCNYKPNLELRERFGRKLLLAGLCLIWGIEIGYKLSTGQLIFILNPCHMVTLLQVNLLLYTIYSHIYFPNFNFEYIFFKLNSSSCSFRPLDDGCISCFAFRHIWFREPRLPSFFPY